MAGSGFDRNIRFGPRRPVMVKLSVEHESFIHGSARGALRSGIDGSLARERTVKEWFDRGAKMANVNVPGWSTWNRKRRAKYGSVPGLPDEELADPEELERVVMIEEWAPILMLPTKQKRGFRPGIDESGDVDWGAFGTVDFDRMRPKLDKLQYKADKLREELEDTLLMFSTVNDRIPGKAKYLVLKHLRLGILGLEHVLDFDMWRLGTHYLRARQLRQEIAELEEASQKRQERRMEAWLGA